VAREEYDDQIEDVPRGNNFRIRREFTVTQLALGVGVAKARLMVKAALTDADNLAKVVLLITEAPAAAGQIIRDGTAGDRMAEVSFELQPVHTLALDAGASYSWSVKIEDDNGGEYTPYIGTLKTRSDVQESPIP
jgi:predicted RecA/RadA family phage recombinase